MPDRSSSKAHGMTCLPINNDEVTVVLPTLNESDAISQVIQELKQERFDNILVVDGYSTDGTEKVARSNGCSVIFQHSRGKSGAIRTAIENVKTPYALVMDGDWTYDPKDIERLLTHAEKYDEIIGSRVNGRGNIPHLNRFGNRLITTAFNVLMGTKLSDVCSGMYMIKTETARRLELNATGFDVEVEIAAQIATSGRITEVPISYRRRIGRQKLNSWKHGFQIILAILGLARAYNPVFLFSGLVSLAIIPASIILGWVAYEVLSTGLWHSGYALTGLMLLVLASQGLTVSTISLLMKRMEKRIMRETEHITSSGMH